MELLQKILGFLAGSRWGLTLLGALATVAVGAGAVPVESSEAKGFGLAAIAILTVVAIVLGPKAKEKLAAFLAARKGGAGGAP